MTPETWTVMLVAAAFLLLGIAISPLAWIALLHRRREFERQMARRMREADDRVRSLEGRLEQFDATAPGQPAREKFVADGMAPHWPHRARALGGRSKRSDATHTEPASTPTLIAIPSLTAPPSEREASVGGISQRYTAIWSLADSGAAADVIARATGQPIGQIELILGLRRQIDASRNKISHGPHT
jgi:hypothetical protein